MTGRLAAVSGVVSLVVLVVLLLAASAEGADAVTPESTKLLFEQQYAQQQLKEKQQELQDLQAWTQTRVKLLDTADAALKALREAPNAELLGPGGAPGAGDATTTAAQDEFTNALRALEAEGVELRADPTDLDAVQNQLGAERRELNEALVAARKAKDEAEQAADAANKAYDKQVEQHADSFCDNQTLAGRLHASRKLRCRLAYCWGGKDGMKYAVAPDVNLPVGIVWAAGNSALASYVNSHHFNIEFSAGVRFWFAYDIASIMVYISRPITNEADPIRIPGSEFEHAPTAVHRAFPSLGLGLFGDVLLLGISYDVLTNGATANTQDPNYPPNSVLSRALTFSLGFSPLGLGTVMAGEAE